MPVGPAASHSVEATLPGPHTGPCHPEAQAHRTGPQTVLRGPKDLVAGTYKPGRGSGHGPGNSDAAEGGTGGGPGTGHGTRKWRPPPARATEFAASRQRLHEVRLRGLACSGVMEARVARPGSARAGPACGPPDLGRFVELTGGASARAVRVKVKPRAGRDSGPSRGFPLFQPRVHPPLEPARGTRRRRASSRCGRAGDSADGGTRTGCVSIVPGACPWQPPLPGPMPRFAGEREKSGCAWAGHAHSAIPCSPRRRTLGRRYREFIRPSRAEASARVDACRRGRVRARCRPRTRPACWPQPFPDHDTRTRG